VDTVALSAAVLAIFLLQPSLPLLAAILYLFLKGHSSIDFYSSVSIFGSWKQDLL
jgi:hypothetical protein